MKLWNKIQSWLGNTPIEDPELPLVVRDHLALVQEFTTDDEPKVVDYPRGQYKVYWEILIGEVPGGVSAQVRFYTYACGTILEQKNLMEPRLDVLKPQVNQIIRTTMAKYRR